MAIDARALDAFLARRGRAVPDVKRMGPETLHRYIEDLTGAPVEFLTEPRPPQLQGLAFALHVERVLLFFYMRMGKSKLALDWATHLALCGRWKTGKGLIVVPRPILLDVWETEVRRHSALKVRTVGPRMDDFLDAIESDAELIVVAWTSLQAMLTIKGKISRGPRKGKPKLYPDHATINALADCFSLVIVDEIHACKNHQSLRFQIGAGLFMNCEFRAGLTGSAWGRNPLDIWAQAYLIDSGETFGRSYQFFEAAFGVEEVNFATGRKEYKFDKSKMPILQEKLASLSLSYKREDIAGQVQEGIIELKLHGDQLEAYNNLIAKLIKTPSGDRQKIKNTFIRLRQAASGYLPFTDEEGEENVVHFTSNSKIEWLSSLFEDLGPDVKVLIFYEFTPSGRKLDALFTSLKIKHTWLWSGTKDKPAAVRDFQHGRAQVLIVNNSSGDVGLDASAADYHLFYESPISTTIRVQAEQRAQGSARGDRVLMLDDIIAAPIEARVYGLIKEGKEVMGEIFRDPRAFAESLKIL